MKKHSGRGWANSFILDLQACIQCELCVQVCPTDAIVMLHGMETPTTRREDLILDKEKLEANGKLYQAAWATGLKLQKLHEPKKPSVISR
jgi:formate hydrogenlyase subunit 6/NADH:ubiquinone oxidoreductase subunit I